MFRRIGWTLINLNNVSMIRAVGNQIKYTLCIHRGSFFFGSGGLESERMYETYSTGEECAKAYNELANTLTKKKELK